MSEPVLVPRSPWAALILVWSVTLVAGVAVGVFVPASWYAHGLLLVFGGSVLLSFAAQIFRGRTEGFIVRVAGSIAGSLLLLGVLSTVLGLVSLVSV